MEEVALYPYFFRLVSFQAVCCKGASLIMRHEDHYHDHDHDESCYPLNRGRFSCWIKLVIWGPLLEGRLVRTFIYEVSKLRGFDGS